MFILECLNSSPFLAGQAPDRKEVCLRTGRVPQNGPDHRAAFHRRTVAAGLVPLLRNTPANAAHAATIGEFHPLRHPMQSMVADVISGVPFITLHLRAVSSRSPSSFNSVALRASHSPQSRPQHAINSLFMLSPYSSSFVNTGTGPSPTPAADSFREPLRNKMFRQTVRIFLLFRQDFQQVVFRPCRSSHRIVQIIRLGNPDSIFITRLIFESADTMAESLPFTSIFHFDGVNIRTNIHSARPYKSRDLFRSDQQFVLPITDYPVFVLFQGRAAAACDTAPAQEHQKYPE